MHTRSEPTQPLTAPEPREFAHQLNNLLTVILANAESSLESGDSAEMRRALGVIATTSISMAELARRFARASSASGARPGANARESESDAR